MIYLKAIITIFTKIRFLVLPILLLTSFGFADDYNLDEFDDLNLNPIEKTTQKQLQKKDPPKQMIIFNDNLYFLDDDFDFGGDEFELKKLELNADDLETAKEYGDFLNAFFNNSTQIGSVFTENQANTIESSNSSIPSVKNTPKKSPKKPKKQSVSKYKPSTASSLRIKPKTGSLGFGTSAILGLTIPVGGSVREQFTPGGNFGFRLETPISFNLIGMESNLGVEIYSSNMGGEESFKLYNYIGNISIFPTSSIEIKTGLGISYTVIGDYGETFLSIPVDFNYYLPMNLGGFKLAVNLHAQRTQGAPGKELEGTTTEFINLGLFINTPFGF